MEARALIAFVVALALTAALTPLVARIARRVGALDPVHERGLASEPMPLLGGLAILAGVLVAGALLLPASTEMRGILGAAALITAVGLLDDLRDLSPGLKLLGQLAAGLVCVLSGVVVDSFTFPFLVYCAHSELLALVTSAQESTTFPCKPAQLAGVIAKLSNKNATDAVPPSGNRL